MTCRPDLRERRRLATQAEIEDAALDLFERQGCESTTVLEIAQAAGVSQSTFFRYFATKEDTALGPHRAFESAFVARLGDAKGRPLNLRSIEEVIAGALRDLSTDAADQLGRIRRVRGLLMRDTALRSAALGWEVEQGQRFLRLLADATCTGPWFSIALAKPWPLKLSPWLSRCRIESSTVCHVSGRSRIVSPSSDFSTAAYCGPVSPNNGGMIVSAVLLPVP